MAGLVDPKVIQDAIAAAQAKATTVSLRESDGDDATVHGLQDTAVDIPAFEGFTEFELDLSCLSPPPSPPASIYTDARSASPTASPRHSMSLHSVSTTQSPGDSPRRDTVSSHLSHVASSSAVRGSWPLMRYVGRGTPIDRNRRIEWGGVGPEDIGEDGLLFSAVRSTSLDSATRPSQRSASPEWSILHRRPSTLPARNKTRSFATELPTPSPEIQIEGLGAENPGEWDSFMQTVLSVSSGSPPEESTSASTSQLPVAAEPPAAVTEPAASALAMPIMSPEEIRKIDTGIDMNLGIDAALDLGLGYRGGMNWFDLGMLPASGRESPSVYSSHPPSPCPSPPLSRAPSVTPLDNRSTTSIKVGQHASLESKTGSQVWWRKFLRRLKRVHVLLGSH
ncbi:hypothetical protein DXG03_002949 [Asterophora parasitica]|uniref:Uncharacterized protein n=1 Tax=Asterophora parasitica TaxID=117018 RepID=A0A9P7KAR5_9AGAR|nr:hypothetical protein DXG03_002949 [Asterophora parasitica]